MQYVDFEIPEGDGVCANNQCSCKRSRILQGTGYLFFSKEAVEFRADCVSLDSYQKKIQHIIENSKVAVAIIPQHQTGPVLICKQSAESLDLDLETAATDARYWWKTGRVPLRPTAISQNENNHPTSDWFKIGLAYGESEQWENALSCFDKVLAMKPNNERAWYSKGVVLGKLGRHNEELNCYDKAIRLNNSYGAAWYNKGAALGNSGRFKEAQMHFEEAWRLGEAQAMQAVIECKKKLEQINSTKNS